MAANDGLSRYDLSWGELSSLVSGSEASGGLGLPAYHARQLWQGMYAQARDIEEIAVLPRHARAALSRHHSLRPGLRLAHESVEDGGSTVKWLWELADQRQIESVLMHYERRSTVCVSTQAGCAMACAFCATGQAGYDRNLRAGEIIEQVVRAQRRATDEGRRVTNVVFMGMGEPLANYAAVWTAVERIQAGDGLGLSARHLTISTVGVVPGIRRLASAALPVNLAVSLHAADDGLRDQLVPINRTYPLDSLLEACREYVRAKGRRLSFEWALIDGVNDGLGDATRLAELARPMGAHVNLIPLNTTPGYAARGSSAARVQAFRDRLHAAGVNATVRRNRGSGIDAACGQLRASATAVAAPKRRRTTSTDLLGQARQ